MSFSLSDNKPWNLVAEGYSEVTMKLFQAYTDAALAMLPLNQQSHLLDVACGPGTTALTAATMVGSVKAIDFSSQMIDILNRTVDKEGIGNIETRCGDGQALPYADDSFDAAVSMFGLMFFPDRIKGYQEILRTLKPGGAAVISSWAPLSQSPAMQAVFGALRAMNPDMPEPQEAVESLENPEFFQQEMARAGFAEVKVVPTLSHTEVVSIEDWWNNMVKGSAPLVMMKRNMTDEQWQEKNKVALAYLHDTIENEKSLSAKAWLGYGLKK